MVNCDDFGRFDGRMKLIASKLFPLKDITVTEMEDAMNALADANLITFYEADGKPYLFMNTWAKHQQSRANKSKYPEPPENICNQMISDDNNGNQMISDDSKCPRIRNRNRNTIHDIRNRNPVPMIDDDNAAGIQVEQNRILDAAEDAGFQRTNSVRARLIDLYSVHGSEKMLNAIQSCVTHGATNLAYLEAVLKGEPKKVQGQDYHQRDYSNAQEEAFERMLKLAGES